MKRIKLKDFVHPVFNEILLDTFIYGVFSVSLPRFITAKVITLNKIYVFESGF